MYVKHGPLGNAPVTGVIARIKHRAYYENAAKAIKAADTVKAVASLKRQLATEKKTSAVQQKIISIKSTGLLTRVKTAGGDLKQKVKGLPPWAKAAGIGAGVLVLFGGVYLARRR